MNHFLGLVRSIARDVRYEIEDLAEKRGVPLARRWDGESNLDLCGWCAIASARLHKELKKSDIDSTICMYEGVDGSHVFLLVDDHVVDITATQFHQHRKTPVLIMHEREAEMYEHYQISKTFTTVKQLISDQKKNRWPVDQTAQL